MSRILYLKNWGRYSVVIDLYSLAIPFNVERYPGVNGWTYRIRFLIVNLHIRTREHYCHV